MNEIVRAFMDIALRRRGPEDLPASGFLMSLTLAGYVAVSAVTIAFYASDAADLAAQIGLDLVLMFGFFGFLLTVHRKMPRFRQTMTAALGTGMLLTAIAIPLVAWLSADTAGPLATAPAVLMYLVVLWSITVTAHILQRALEIPFLGGVILAVGYFLLNVAAFARFFPAEG